MNYMQLYLYKHLRETESTDSWDWRSHRKHHGIDGHVAYHLKNNVG